MIFDLLIIHNHDRTSSITRVLHTATWYYYTSRLPDHFRRSPKVVKEAIMTDINDLVQEFWRTLSDGTVGASFFEMRRLFEILEGCFGFMVCFDIISVFATAVYIPYKSTDADKTQFLELSHPVGPRRNRIQNQVCDAV